MLADGSLALQIAPAKVGVCSSQMGVQTWGVVVGSFGGDGLVLRDIVGQELWSLGALLQQHPMPATFLHAPALHPSSSRQRQRCGLPAGT